MKTQIITFVCVQMVSEIIRQVLLALVYYFI